MSSNKIYWPFDILGFTEIPSEKRDIKRAYAKRLKQIDQAADPQGFQKLREAYECALSDIEYHTQGAADVPAFKTAVVPPPSPPPAAPIPPLATVPPSEDSDTLDWSRVQDLCDQVANYTIIESNIDRLQRIFNDPVFDDLRATHDLEQSAFDYVHGNLQRINGHPEFSLTISKDILGLIDQRFGWYSDSVSFQRRFIVPSDFIIAMSSKLAPAGAFVPPMVGYKKWQQRIVGFLSKGWFWVGWIGLMILLVNLLPKPYVRKAVGVMMMLPLTLFFGFMALLFATVIWRNSKSLYYAIHDAAVGINRFAKRVFKRNR